jgi:hypothetical protein
MKSKKESVNTVRPDRISDYLRSEESNYSGAMIVHEHLEHPEDRLCIMQARLYGTLVLLLNALVKDGIQLETILAKYLEHEVSKEDAERSMLALSRFLVFSNLETATAIGRVNWHIANLRAKNEMRRYENIGI